MFTRFTVESKRRLTFRVVVVVTQTSHFNFGGKGFTKESTKIFFKEWDSVNVHVEMSVLRRSPCKTTVSDGRPSTNTHHLLKIVLVNTTKGGLPSWGLTFESCRNVKRPLRWDG